MIGELSPPLIGHYHADLKTDSFTRPYANRKGEGESKVEEEYRNLSDKG